NIVISLILSKYFDIYGLILGTVLSSMISLIMVTFAIRKNYTLFAKLNIDILNEIIKVIISFIITLSIYITLNFKFQILNPYIKLAAYTPILIIIYCGILFLTKSKIYKIKI
ncbi:polysaccharide biosynthesis C-terminal domain-containing protein, partial [Gottfriedia acidiceleris]|uniref:polysaccharide biosynthesis C-terminal domain-containing protein n=1 Tax=Gottfriedia acidiceleris TaxID=371036 RepID=UPI002FFF2909